MNLPSSWSESDLEWWEERAAILEHDAGLPRPEAEHQAFLLMLRPNPLRDVGLDYEPPNAGRYVPADWITQTGTKR